MSVPADDEPVAMEASEEPNPVAKSSHDVQTQWSDPGMEDHIYPKAPPARTSSVLPEPSPESSQSVAEDLLKHDEDCLLYTGIPLLEFNTLVSCLQSFVRTSTMLVLDGPRTSTETSPQGLFWSDLLDKSI